MSTPERAPGRRPAPADLLTIGEVLGSLRAEFPDITPSKVRFLEERGLVTPARTPSGYRKFAPAHVARLRLVLTLQRDHYLPLRVIGEHLAALDAGQDPELPPVAPPGPDAAGQQPAQPPPPQPEPPETPGGELTSDHVSTQEQTEPTRAPGPPAAPRGRRPAPPAPPATTPPATTTSGPLQEPPARPQRATAAPATSAPARASFAGLVEVAAGDVALVDALIAHALLPRPLDSGDAAAAEQVVRAAAALGAHGIEPRHLRVLKTAAEREAALVEQIATPLRRVRSGDDVDGRAQRVTAALSETLGELRSALLATELAGRSR